MRVLIVDFYEYNSDTQGYQVNEIYLNKFKKKTTIAHNYVLAFCLIVIIQSFGIQLYKKIQTINS